jgi:hypothetical protein
MCKKRARSIGTDAELADLNVAVIFHIGTDEYKRQTADRMPLQDYFRY